MNADVEQDQYGLNTRRVLARISKAQTDDDVCRLIAEATADSRTLFAFADFLDDDRVTGLTASPEHAAYYRLIQLFAWGTWSEWNDHQTEYPPLSDDQQHKLRQLSIISMVRPGYLNPDLGDLYTELGVGSDSHLNVLLRDAIANGYISGKIDIANQRLVVLATADCRDPSPADISESIGMADQWVGRIDRAIETAQAAIKDVQECSRRRQLMQTTSYAPAV